MGVFDDVVDRLTAEFPAVPAAEVRQVVTAAWSMFATAEDGAAQDETRRAAVTEWYARVRLQEGSERPGE